MSNLVFDSRLNYQKKFMTGSYSASLSAANSYTTTQTITHNLGYKPNLRVFQEIDGDGRIRPPYPLNILKESIVTAKVYNDRVEITAASPSLNNAASLKIYYEIYLDADDTGETDLEFISTYPIDKILDVVEGSYTVPAEDSATSSVAHSFGRPLIFRLAWSFDNVSWYPIADYFSASDVDDFFVGEVDVSATHINLYAFNGFATQKTFYYKVYLIEPEEDYPADYGSTVNKLVLSSQYDSFKNFESTEQSQIVSGSIASGGIATFTSTLTHTQGNNIADLYFKESTADFYYGVVAGVGTGLLRVDVTGGASATDLPVEIFLDTSNNLVRATLWVYNYDANTVTIVPKTFNLRFVAYLEPTPD